MRSNESVNELFEKAEQLSPGLVNSLRDLVDTGIPLLVINQSGFDDEKRVYGALAIVCNRYLGFKPEHVGTLPDDPSVRVSVRRMRPVLLDADCQFGRCLENFVEATLALAKPQLELLLGASAAISRSTALSDMDRVKTNGAILRVASLGPNGRMVGSALDLRLVRKRIRSLMFVMYRLPKTNLPWRRSAASMTNLCWRMVPEMKTVLVRGWARRLDDNHPIEAPSDARVDVDQPVAGHGLSDDEAASETSNSTDRSVEDIGTTDSVDAGDVDSIASETDVEDGINDKGEPAGPHGDTAVDAVENEVAAADTDISADGTPGEDGASGEQVSNDNVAAGEPVS